VSQLDTRFVSARLMKALSPDGMESAKRGADPSSMGQGHETVSFLITSRRQQCQRATEALPTAVFPF
jgi:hypothetical protein